MRNKNIFDLRLPAEMAKFAEQVGVNKINKKKKISFFLALYGWCFYFYRICFLYHCYYWCNPS